MLRDECGLFGIENLKGSPNRALGEARWPAQARRHPPPPTAAQVSERRTARSASAERLQEKAAAAGADRRQHALRRMADDEENRARRRLLDHLEERVGARGRQVLRAVDDADAVAALARRGAEKARARRTAVDGIVVEWPLLSVARARAAARSRDRDGRGPRPAAPPACCGSTRRAPCLRPAQRRLGEEEPRDPIGERRLADPCRAADEPGMVKAAGASASRKARSASPWPKNAVCSRGCGAPGERSGSTRSMSAGTGFAPLSRRRQGPEQPLLDERPRSRASTLSASPVGVDDDAALGLAVGDAQESLRASRS